MKATQEKPWLKFYKAECLAMQYEEMTITDYLLAQNKDRMDITAISYFDRKITHRELFAHIYETANAFASLGVKENDFVLICAVAAPEIAYTFYGLSLLGAASNMLDPRFSVEGMHNAILEMDVRVVVVLDMAYEKMCEAIKGTHVEKVIVLSPGESLPAVKKFVYRHFKDPMKKKGPLPENFCHWSEFIAAGKDYPATYLHDCADHCAVVVHTGGTTGTSKSVMLSHNNINNVHFQYLKYSLDIVPGKDKFLDVMPTFIAYGLGYGIHLPLSWGMTCIIVPKLEPGDLAGEVLKYKPQVIACTPAIFKVMIRDRRMRKADLSFFKNSCVGGDAISLYDEERVNAFLKEHNAKWDLSKGYGMSEVSAVSTASLCANNKLGSVGVPMADVTVAAFDPDSGEELDIGEVGEICINSPTMMMGYYGRPEETAHMLRRHEDGLTWVHSGDLGYVDEDGYVFIKGRIKRMFMDHIGYKIFSSAIEDALSLCEDIAGSCVVGVTDHEHVQGKLPHAFVVLSAKCSESKEAVEEKLRQLCQQKLVEYMWPAYYTFLDVLPTTPIGKVDFRKLERMAEASHSPKA